MKATRTRRGRGGIGWERHWQSDSEVTRKRVRDSETDRKRAKARSTAGAAEQLEEGGVDRSEERRREEIIGEKQLGEPDGRTGG